MEKEQTNTLSIIILFMILTNFLENTKQKYYSGLHDQIEPQNSHPLQSFAALLAVVS